MADVSGERFLLSKYIGSQQIEYYELNVLTKALTPVLGQNEVESYQVRLAPKAGEYLVLTNKFSDLNQIYVYKDKKWTLKVSHPKKEISGFFIDYPRKSLVVQWIDRAYMSIEVYDPRTFNKIKIPQFAGAENVYAGGITRDGRYLSLGIDRATEPRASFVWDFEKKALTQWHRPSSPEINTKDFAQATLEYYEARDGTPIPMFVRRPQHCEKQLCPVIVDFHGGPEGTSYPGFSSYAQIFVDAGFIWVEPNVRGSDGFGRKWLESDDGPKRLRVITDIEDAALYIKKHWAKNGVAPKIGVSGGSYGGYSTLMAMTRFAGSYDAGVASVGMSNLLSFLMNTAPYRRQLRISEYGDPENDREALIALSPVTYVDKIQGPLMIIQGVNDPRVPAGEAVQMYKAVRAKGLDAELVLFADEGHGLSKRSNRVLAIGHSLSFFEKHLK